MKQFIISQEIFDHTYTLHTLQKVWAEVLLCRK